MKLPFNIKPLFLNNEVRIETWISKLNNTSVIMEFRFYNEKDELCATGQQKGLFVDVETMCPVCLPGKCREAFEKFLN